MLDIGVEYGGRGGGGGGGGGAQGPGPPPRETCIINLIINYSRALIIVPIVCACDIPHGIQ